MAGSVSGLASGLDTATIINQLMQLEATSQNRLKNRVTTEQRQVTSLQTLNSKLASLAETAAKAADPLSWSAAKGTSSATGVTVTAAATADATRLSATVVQTARSHQLGFASAAALTDVVVPPATGTSVRIDRLDGTTVDLDTGNGTLKGLIDAINDPDNATGLRASAVRVADGSYKLLVESTATGAAQDFALTATDGSPLLGGATVRAARDAQLDLGAGIVATSTTNTFTDLLPGVTVTVASSVADGTTTELTVGPDTAGAGTLVKGLVDGLNAALTEMRSLTTMSGTASARGLLAGDASVRAVQGQLEGTLFGPEGSLAGLGLEIDRNGKVTFDQAAFDKAYAADPTGVAAKLADGFATRVEKVAERASDKVDGVITTAITGRQDSIKTLNQNIEAWDTRLELRRTALTRQFTALETALSQMNSQATWLAGQISSLPGAQG